LVSSSRPLTGGACLETQLTSDCGGSWLQKRLLCHKATIHNTVATWQHLRAAPCHQAQKHGSVRTRIFWELHMDLTPASSPATIDGKPEKIEFSYVKRPGLVAICFINFFLGLITLGFYRFWGKTNVRKHIWSSVHINGEPLEYTGTGMELFKGFLVVFFVFILPYVIASTIAQVYNSAFAIILQLLLILAIYVLIGFAIYKARKYQLSRTNWRGIRGTLVGSAMTYSLLFFGSLIAKSMSFGWSTPVMNTVLQEQITNDMRFGDAAFKFKGRAGPLYPTYALCWFLSLGAVVFAIVLAVGSTTVSSYFSDMFDPNASPESIEQMAGFVVLISALLFLAFMLIIPMLWAIYIAKELRTFANYTRFDGVPFRLDATAGSVIGLTIVNLLLIVFTLGIATPIAQQRTVKFVIDRLKLEGLVDIDRVRQSTAKMDKRGEGLADAFDIGGI
jgi:uncharacterized membrane protein YjgN (DUF898 family)